MLKAQLKKALKYYFITEDNLTGEYLKEQVTLALEAGATIVQYRNTAFSPQMFNDLEAVRDLLKCNNIPFIVEGDILLAKAVASDGVLLDLKEDDMASARLILGDAAIVGVAVSSKEEITSIDTDACDYILVGPLYTAHAASSSSGVIELSELSALVKETDMPIVVYGEAAVEPMACFGSGAAGIAVSHEGIANLCNPPDLSGRRQILMPWNNEFYLIDNLLKYGPKETDGIDRVIKVPPGDDACLLTSLEYPVITTDSHVEGVHFRLDWQTPEEIGWKAVSVTLSDLAASYAKPVSMFINLGLPPYIANTTVEALYKGVGNALTKYGCSLGGGNVSANNRISLELFAIGEGREIFPVRNSASPGYGLYCTGPLGLARAGLDALKRKTPEYNTLISCFKSPTARFDAAEILEKHGVDCVMDISDGLKGDAEHMAKASNITIEFSISPGDIDPDLKDYCAAYGLEPYAMAVAGGEDYELLFACPPETFQKIKTKLKSVYQVGNCLSFNGRYLQNPPSIDSFQHGK